ncbi:MAG: UbiA family prenyltransferase [Algicola sp.]|nr:UbiA family prenyltransferase [Algicola sp.]
MHILNLIRWKNLAIIIIAQVLIKYALFEPFDVNTALSTVNFMVLVVATLCCAAAGNIINDIYDVETDLINKPEKVIIGKQVSESLAYNLFFGCNIAAIALGFYLSHNIGKSSFFSIFVIISLALYVYASYLKGTVVIGNLLISLLVGTSILIVAIFDLLPMITPYNRISQIKFFSIVVDYSVFAFLINLIREMVKDIQDVDGDYKAGMNTLPIVLGRERTGKIAFIVSMLPIAAVLYFVVTYLYKNQMALGYFLLFVIAPLIYASIKIFTAKHQKHYAHISRIYKWIMLTGLLSLLMYPFLLK